MTVEELQKIKKQIEELETQNQQAIFARENILEQLQETINVKTIEEAEAKVLEMEEKLEKAEKKAADLENKIKVILEEIENE